MPYMPLASLHNARASAPATPPAPTLPADPHGYCSPPAAWRLSSHGYCTRRFDARRRCNLIPFFFSLELTLILTRTLTRAPDPNPDPNPNAAIRSVFSSLERTKLILSLATNSLLNVCDAESGEVCMGIRQEAGETLKLLRVPRRTARWAVEVL